MTDLIACPALHVKITPFRCKMTRAENEGFWESEQKSKEMVKCPCEQEGKKVEKTIIITLPPPNEPPLEEVQNEPMPKTGFGRKPFKRMGTCPVCNHPDKRLYAHHGQDICGGCKNKSRTEKRRKEIMAGRNILMEGEENPTRSTTPENVDKIILPIRTEMDTRILSFLQARAEECRRTLVQQTLWELQSHLPETQGAT